MKKKTIQRFSILIVPDKDSHIKRFEFSRRGLIASCASIAFACIAVCASFFALAHYYRAYSSTEDARIRAAQFERERSNLVAKVGELEESLLRTQRFAVKLETITKAKDELKGGLGPLEGHIKSLTEALSSDEGASITWRPPSSDYTSGELLANVDVMKNSATDLEELLHSVFARQQDNSFFWSSLPTAWPTRGFVTSQFHASRGHRLHEGLDIAGRVGTPIVAPGDGIVTFTGYKGGYGNTMKIDHGYGMVTVHAHCSRIFVSEGDKVKRGEVVASVGNTGSSTGPHLHYEVRIDGVSVDPMRYLAKR